MVYERLRGWTSGRSLPVQNFVKYPPGPGGTPYNGLYGEAPPERGTFFRLQVYKRVAISQVEVYIRVGKFNRAFNYNISNRRPVWLYQLIYQVLHENDNKTSKSGYVKGVPFFNKRYIKRLPFLRKWYIKGQGVGPRGGASPY